MCGGLISLIYAVLCNTWPVVVLNACLICINFVQTVRYLKEGKRQQGSCDDPEEQKVTEENTVKEKQ